MRGSRMTVQLASMGDAVMERPRRRDLARFHVRPRVRPVLGESPPEFDESHIPALDHGPVGWIQYPVGLAVEAETT